MFHNNMLVPLSDVSVDASIMAGLIKVDLHLTYVNGDEEVDAYFEYPLRTRQVLSHLSMVVGSNKEIHQSVSEKGSKSQDKGNEKDERLTI